MSEGQPNRWRRSEWITFGGVALAIGWIWAASAKSEKLDELVLKVYDNKHGIDPLNERVAVLETQNQQQLRLLYAISKAVGARSVRDAAED